MKSLSDSERETRISKVISEITALLPKHDQLSIVRVEKLNNELKKLVAGRSKRQIARMEKEKGLL